MIVARVRAWLCRRLRRCGASRCSEPGLLLLVGRFFGDAWIDDCCVLMIVCVSPGLRSPQG